MSSGGESSLGGDYNAYTVHIQSDDNNIIPDNITE